MNISTKDTLVDVIQEKIFEEELQSSYLDYSMSVIVSRALPDAYDGLKPVQRRILYSMIEGNCVPENPHRKSARIVGDVLGKYHPHGEAAIYDAMTRLAQDFSVYVPLVDGQGNFGSIDGDKPASMRYTEARLAKITKYLLEDYDKNTVDMSPNYDGTLEMPNVLPARFPNLLVNGASGIAVGMATSIPTHNLTEVINATCALIDDPSLTSIDLMQHLPAPDFPLGGTIFQGSGLIDIYTKGKGSFVARGNIHDEVVNSRKSLVITSIPYQVNKENMMDKVAELMQTDILSGIHTFRDESNQDGMRIVLELKKDIEPEIIKNRVYKFTQMQVNIHANMLALHKNKPEQLNLKDLLSIFLHYREEVLIRRTKFFLHNDRVKAHVLWGLSLAVKKLDEIVYCIKTSKDTQEAQTRLQAIEWSWEDIEGYLHCISETCERVEKYHLSLEQVKAILNLRLSKLTGLERDKLWQELQELGSNIRKYLMILNSKEERLKIIKADLIEVQEKFGAPRRTSLDVNLDDATDESYIKSEDMVVTLSSKGYVKSMPLSSYKLQKRGGKGKIGMDSQDPVEHLFVANTHQEVIFFSSTGYSYSMKVYKLPTVGSGHQRGRALVNLFPLDDNEKIMSSVAMPKEVEDQKTIIFVTSSGYVRRNSISQFQDIRSNGKIAMKLNEGESLVSVMVCDEQDDILLTSSQGKLIRFPVKSVRIFESRSSHGVIGMNLSGDTNNRVVSATLINSDDNESMVLTVSKNGYGKRSSYANYRQSNRAGKGVAALDVTSKTGEVLGAYRIDADNEILMMTEKGQIIRSEADDVRVTSRKTQGVRLVRLDDDTLVKVLTISDNSIGDDELE